MTTPAIAAVAQNPDEMGRVAGRLVLEKLVDSQTLTDYSFQEVRIATQFILRGSV
jgi:DNA-binding LacI/PurR family transcriptional regulator